MLKHRILLGLIGALFITNANALGPDNWPKLKPGMIATTMTMNGKKLSATKMCMTEATMKEAEKMGKDYQDKSCAKANYRQSGKTYLVDMVCKDEQGKEMKISTEATMVTDQHMTVKSTSSVDGKTTKTEQDIQRVGDCDKESMIVEDADGNTMDMSKIMEQLKNMKK